MGRLCFHVYPTAGLAKRSVGTGAGSSVGGRSGRGRMERIGCEKRARGDDLNRRGFLLRVSRIRQSKNGKSFFKSSGLGRVPYSQTSKASACFTLLPLSLP